jgi:hypothetical protein
MHGNALVFRFPLIKKQVWADMKDLEKLGLQMDDVSRKITIWG